MKKLLSFLILVFACFSGFSQCVNHWESCVLETTAWKYKVPTAAITGWQLPAFNDASWTNGVGGIGYADGDDNTSLPNPTTSVYMRKAFTIVDTAAIKYAIFCMDFDDGFVAYLNGKEIARSNMGPNQQWNSLALSSVEAQLYQGLQPAYFVLSSAAIDTLLINGTNLLCVETHNFVTTSNDLSSRPFLHLVAMITYRIRSSIATIRSFRPL